MPAVSVILAAYQAEATIGRSLQALREQTFRDFEVIIIDSSPDAACERIVTAQFGEFRYERAQKRLSDDAARNRGIKLAAAPLIATTDPDAYARGDWLENLVKAHNRRGGLVVGGVACHGTRWLDLGVHLCKFDKWLPRSSARRLNDGPTVNMFFARSLLDSVGGVLADGHGDTDLCWRLRQKGHELWFAPNAVVEHHHLHTWRSFLSERLQRGREFGQLRLRWHRLSGSRVAWRLTITLLPARLLSQMLRVGKNAAEAGALSAYFWTLPIVASGLYSWLLGEARTYMKPMPAGARPSNE